MVKNRRFWVVGLVGAVLVAGCASIEPPVPAGHVGPVAILKDSAKSYGSRKADLFYAAEVDGRRIEDSRSRTDKANRGAGFSMTPALVERNIPAKAAEIKIVARTVYAAPILAMTNDVFQVEGVVTFTPEPYKTYVVVGELGESYSAVWLEEEGTRKVVGEKIEAKGSAKLGAFQK